MALEPHLTRRAENTAHRAACLRGDAQRTTIFGAPAGGGTGDLRIIRRVAVAHQNSFDQIPSGSSKRVLRVLPSEES